MSDSLVIILDNLRSLHNIGSIFRTADGLNISEIVLIGPCGFPPHSELTKTALGAENAVSWSYFPSKETALVSINKDDTLFIAVETGPNAIPATKLTTVLDGEKRKLALILGSETDGVSPELLDLAELQVQIPMQGIKESFNVSIAAAMICYELQRLKLTS